jgi:hypothetical protein
MECSAVSRIYQFMYLHRCNPSHGEVSFPHIGVSKLLQLLATRKYLMPMIWVLKSQPNQKQVFNHNSWLIYRTHPSHMQSLTSCKQNTFNWKCHWKGNSRLNITTLTTNCMYLIELWLSVKLSELVTLLWTGINTKCFKCSKVVRYHSKFKIFIPEPLPVSVNICSHYISN